MTASDGQSRGLPPASAAGNGGGSSAVSDHAISRLLADYQQGSPDAKDALIQVIYDELKQIARRVLRVEMTRDQSLGITGLVHEAYLRIESNGLFNRVDNSRHLFGAVHRAMRQVLVDRARYRNAQKRPDGHRRLSLDDHLDKLEQISRCSMLELHDSLEKLATKHARAAEVLDMRLFGELDMQSIAELLEVSLSTVEADFRFARAMLFQELNGE